MQREQVELQGIQFPASIRDEGASVELLNIEGANLPKGLEDWVSENHLASERQWGIISQARSKEEILLLALSFRKVLRTRYKMQAGRLTKQQEESTEPELGEFHFRRDGAMELYSVGAKQRNMVLQSLGEALGDKQAAKPLFLSKESMLSLMSEATEVSSVSLSGIGNPFFNEMSLSGADPSNSRTFKEMLSSGVIKSFRARYHIDSSAGSEGGAQGKLDSLLVTVSSNCKVRFYAGGQVVLSQSDVEEFLARVRKLASSEVATE